MQIRVQIRNKKMVTINLYLDARACKENQAAPIKFSIRKDHRTAFISTNLKVTKVQWNANEKKVIKHPNKAFFNNFLQSRKIEIERLILSYEDKGLKFDSITVLRDRILSDLHPEIAQTSNLFATRFRSFIETKTNPGTRKLYETTLNRLAKYDANINKLRFEDITKAWLTGLEVWLSENGAKEVNARAVYFRNIRAVFNDAIDDEVTTFYPFRKFKIKKAATRKRAMTVDDLRTLINYPLLESRAFYRDMFALDFYLIGINIVDLFNAKKIEDGRLYYTRAKTGKQYNIKVEPEAVAIINKYKGVDRLIEVPTRLKSFKDHTNFLKNINRNLRKIDTKFEKITTYYARHSWATIAAELEIPKETIAAALGHGGDSVTDIYIKFDSKKIDFANRRVIDYVLYNRL